MADVCSTCRWHVRHKHAEPGIRDGICHRYPTTVPKNDGDFCGEHKPSVDQGDGSPAHEAPGE